MPTVAVEFRDDRVEFEVGEDRLVGAWNGPDGMAADAFRARLSEALEGPIGYPPLRRNVVPGDRVVLAIDPGFADVSRAVAIVANVLLEAGVESVKAVSLGPIPADQQDDWPEAVPVVRHDPEPEDPASLAYLASTQTGRRIYLNRELTEADVVVPVAGLGFDPVLGYKGPWSALFPGLSDAASIRANRESAQGVGRGGTALEESGEVAWLLGSLLHVGILPGTSGVASVVVGEAGEVRSEGIRRVDSCWTFRPETRADLVIAGIGVAGRPTSLDDLALGLSTAAGLVRRGGKIALLSRAEGVLGPALTRLSSLDDPTRGASKALRESRFEVDGPAALALADALAWADIYLLSLLNDDLVDDLGMIPLSSPDEARRLASTSPSTLVLSHADRTRAAPVED